MSRVINSETPGKKRASILKLLVNLMPIMMKYQNETDKRNDLIAFIVLSLDEVEKSIMDTITPWEKRGYWTKAERFSADWRWVNPIKKEIIEAHIPKGWQDWPEAINELYTHLTDVKPTRQKLGNFWEGSYVLYKKQYP